MTRETARHPHDYGVSPSDGNRMNAQIGKTGFYTGERDAFEAADFGVYIVGEWGDRRRQPADLVNADYDVAADGVRERRRVSQKFAFVAI